LPILRICDDLEKPQDLFFIVGLVVEGMLLISFLSAIFLFYMGNYYTVYKFSKKVFCGFPIIHPVLLQDIVSEYPWRDYHRSIKKHKLDILMEACMTNKHLVSISPNILRAAFTRTDPKREKRQ